MTEKFLSNPNLPTNKVTLVAVSSQYPKTINRLNGMGINCMEISPANNLQKPVAAHTDMNILHMGNNNFALNRANTLAQSDLIATGANIDSLADLAPIYPNDVKLNIAIIGENVICNEKYADKNVLSLLNKAGKNVINVNQGYSRCSIAVVNEYSIMTSDPTIVSVCANKGYNVLFLEAGDIELPGYDYGFIGGCCGLIDKNVLAFTGDIHKYKNHREVINFLKENNCDYICLSDDNIIDIGGIIPIKEFI